MCLVNWIDYMNTWIKTKKKRARKARIHHSQQPNEFYSLDARKLYGEMGEEKNWPSQSKMKVSTESMSSSAFWSGWAEARTAKPSILDLLNFLLELVFHPKLTYPEQEQSDKLGEKWLKPKNLGMLRFKLEKDLDAFVEEATMSECEAAVLVLLSISVYLFSFL